MSLLPIFSTPTSSVEGGHTIQYVFADIMTGSIIEELPLHSVTFSYSINAAGRWGATLRPEDPYVQEHDWLDATLPAKRTFWVLIDTVPVYGGIVWTRQYSMSNQTVVLGGSDHWSYFAQRLQAQDYGTTWDNTIGFSAPLMANQIISDAQAVQYSMPITINLQGTANMQRTDICTFVQGEYWVSDPSITAADQFTAVSDSGWTWSDQITQLIPGQGFYMSQPAGSSGSAVSTLLSNATYWVPLSAPLSERQTIDSIVHMLSGLGWEIGFDYATDCTTSGTFGNPAPSVTLSYPRRGTVAGQSQLTVDIDTADDFEFDEDGTQCANVVYEFGSGTGGVELGATWPNANTIDGYPLLERVMSHPSLASTSEATTVMDAMGQGDLAVLAYPPIAPTVTIPLFGDPAIGQWKVGDDVRVISEAMVGPDTSACPRFPNGLDYWLRIVQADVTIADKGGYSTVKFTLNLPPTMTPVYSVL